MHEAKQTKSTQESFEAKYAVAPCTRGKINQIDMKSPIKYRDKKIRKRQAVQDAAAHSVAVFRLKSSMVRPSTLETGMAASGA